ncbi:plasma membrane calcium-transporting atpase 2 [Stemphylium lycopersici]|nr:plasma membrane calcium-transporting atpase 2 [Stemphylium lycopersici]
MAYMVRTKLAFNTLFGGLPAVRALAAAYDVPESTLRTRLRGTQPRSETVSVNRKLLAVEEQSLVQWILDLDRRGFPPQVIDVRRMADALLAGRGQDLPPPPIGKNWDIDTYNFDETGFMMGVAATSKVVTSSDTVGRAVTVQPGNRDWVTTIECINASGWCLPPFVILSGKLYQASWYQHLPPDWVVAVSDNGWTTDELGFEWVKHFNRHTASRTYGAYRLLILDGYSSHATPEFDQYCTENKIITLCMPAHTSYLLQPLNVSCFSPLKRAYGHEIQELARQGVYHVDKIDFLMIYRQIRPIVFTQESIQAGFQATGLIPPCPDRVLSSLTIVRTPSPPGTIADDNVAWTAETPHTVAQLQQQARYI